MTQGGKPHRSQAPQSQSAFAPMRGWLSANKRDVISAAENLAAELARFGEKKRIAIQVIDSGQSHMWEIEAGQGEASIKSDRSSAKADLTLVMRGETWLDLAQGQINPFDAFAGGKLRVAGDTELGKRLVRHLTDPQFPFISPC
jgi:putative sterol carrier protein